MAGGQHSWWAAIRTAHYSRIHTLHMKMMIVVDACGGSRISRREMWMQ